MLRMTHVMTIYKSSMLPHLIYTHFCLLIGLGEPRTVTQTRDALGETT